MRRIRSGTGRLGMTSLINEKFALQENKMIWNLGIGVRRMLGIYLCY